jgi:hypothetical protein
MQEGLADGHPYKSLAPYIETCQIFLPNLTGLSFTSKICIHLWLELRLAALLHGFHLVVVGQVGLDVADAGDEPGDEDNPDIADA